jgi:hypothetical protein
MRTPRQALDARQGNSPLPAIGISHKRHEEA